MDKYNVVEKYIRDCIDKTEIGGKLPSVRSIKETCKVSEKTIDRVVERLMLENLVEMRPRSGLYKRKAYPRDIKIVCFVGSHLIPEDSNATFYQQVMYSLFYMLSQENRRISIITANNSTEELELLKSLKNDLKSTIILFNAAHEHLLPIEEARASGTRIVDVLPMHDYKLNAAITNDDAKIVRMQLEYLNDRNHKRIAYANAPHGLHRRPLSDRWDAFVMESIKLKMEPVVSDYNINAHSSFEDVYSNTVELIKNESTRPDAIILGEDIQYKAVYDAITSQGLVVGEDISVIGTNDSPWSSYAIPPLTTIGFDIYNGLKEFMNIIENIEERNEGSITKFPLKLVERSSVIQS
ncbi:LacI family DNA-binding transcriptional regulator [Lentisphaerota bacterium WC36G]|nr:LacI family transcriptional regulator [Lentisphaerae bacterium WC36]